MTEANQPDSIQIDGQDVPMDDLLKDLAADLQAITVLRFRAKQRRNVFACQKPSRF